MQMVPDSIPDKACTNPAIREVKRANQRERVNPHRIAGKNSAKAIIERVLLVRWHASSGSAPYRVFT